MGKMTLKNYAVKHKTSLFNVVKMVKSGKLKNETVREEGKETVYILIDDNESEGEGIYGVEKHQSEEKALHVRVSELEKELKKLREAVESMQKSV